MKREFENSNIPEIELLTSLRNLSRELGFFEPPDLALLRQDVLLHPEEIKELLAVWRQVAEVIVYEALTDSPTYQKAQIGLFVSQAELLLQTGHQTECDEEIETAWEYACN